MKISDVSHKDLIGKVIRVKDEIQCDQYEWVKGKEVGVIKNISYIQDVGFGKVIYFQVLWSDAQTQTWAIGIDEESNNRNSILTDRFIEIVED